MAATISKSIDQLTFNVFLVAYDHGLDLKHLQTASGQRLGFRDIKRNTKLADLKDDAYTIPPLTPTHQELSIDQSANVGIWVGMRPSNSTASKAADMGNNKGKSIKALALSGGYTILESDPNASRVVVPMHKETASYYALVDQDATTGLCSGINVPITEVFFFPQFRNDDLTDTAKRRSEWSELVRKVSNPVEKINFTKNYDKTKFIVPPNESYVNDLTSFVSTYFEGADASVLKSGMQLIHRMDTDGAFTPPHPHNNALAQLAQSTTRMSNKQCEAALSELLVSDQPCYTLPPATWSV